MGLSDYVHVNYLVRGVEEEFSRRVGDDDAVEGAHRRPRVHLAVQAQTQDAEVVQGAH